MYVVQCPKCHATLKLDKQVTAKFKCSKCATIFQGTSAPADGPAAAPQRPQQPAAAPRPAAPAARPAVVVRQRTNPVPVILVCVFGFALLVFMVVFIYNLATPKAEIRDDKGRLLSVVSKDDAVRFQKEQEEAAKAAATGTSVVVRRPSEPAGPSRSDPYAPTITPQRGGGLPGELGTAAPVVPASAPSAAPPAAKPGKLGDASIVVVPSGEVANPTDTGGYIVGMLTNNNAHVLKTVSVSIRFQDDKGNVKASPSAQLEMIPPRGTVRFSVPYGTLSAEEIKTYDSYAKGEPAASDLTGWVIDSSDTQTIKREGGTVIVTGRTRNTTGARVSNAKVYCDFFTRDGIYAGSAVGKILGDSASVGNAAVDYEVKFDAAASRKAMPEAIDIAVARIIGNK
jgi:hypothetical protein